MIATFLLLVSSQTILPSVVQIVARFGAVRAFGVSVTLLKEMFIIIVPLGFEVSSNHIFVILSSNKMHFKVSSILILRECL